MTTDTKAPYINDPDFQLYVGDVREQLRNLPAESVHCVVTSPPYWGLRDFGTGVWDGGDPDCDHLIPAGGPKRGLNGHNIKYEVSVKPAGEVCPRCGARRVDQQLGLEPTPDLYVQNMVDVFREVRRVLRRDGTCWLNIGDSYGSGTTSDRGPTSTEGPDVPASWSNRSQAPRNGLKPKDLVGIPWRLAFALQADGWYLRSDVIWSKPNPMPESVTDRPTKAHEYLFLLTRSPRYFYDADAIREPAEYGRRIQGAFRSGSENGDGHRSVEGSVTGGDPSAGRNRRSVWEIPTEPYPAAHFATFPQALVEPCVLAGTSERGCCPECGAPWERETERVDTGKRQKMTDGWDTGDGAHGTIHRDGREKGETGIPILISATIGWRPTCECDVYKDRTGTYHRTPVPCTVLDPFMGSGTTALVARRLGRKSIGIELNEEYARLCAHRLQQLSLLA